MKRRTALLHEVRWCKRYRNADVHRNRLSVHGPLAADWERKRERKLKLRPRRCGAGQPHNDTDAAGSAGPAAGESVVSAETDPIMGCKSPGAHQKQWQVTQMTCDRCNHPWVAVHQRCERLECPNCTYLSQVPPILEVENP